MNDSATTARDGNVLPAGSTELARTVGSRLKALLAARKVRNPATGEVMPMTVNRLFRIAEARYSELPFSNRHLYRLTSGTTYPRLDTLWMLAELLGVHPAYLVGVDGVAAPSTYPDPTVEPPNSITIPIAELLQQHVSLEPVPGKLLADDLLEKIREHALYEPVSSRHITRLLKGRAIPRLNNIYAISEVLDLDPVDFLRWP